MKKHIFILTFLIISSILLGQKFNRCVITQFTEHDSLNIKEFKTILYNKNGQVVSEIEKDFKESTSLAYDYYYFYDDTLLIKSISVDKNNDSIKSFHTYNEKGQKIKTEHYNLKKRFNNIKDKENEQSSRYIKTEHDNEKKMTWEKVSEIFFKYDDKGNTVIYDATKLHWDNQNKYIWKYDDKNRIIEHSSFNCDKGYPEQLIWTESYIYYDKGYKFIRTWYDTEGNPKHLKEKSWEYWPQYTFTYILNNNGKVVQEKVTDEKDKMISKEITKYNEFSLISRIIIFNKNDEPIVTRIYSYIK